MDPPEFASLSTLSSLQAVEYIDGPGLLRAAACAELSVPTAQPSRLDASKAFSSPGVLRKCQRLSEASRTCKSAREQLSSLRAFASPHAGALSLASPSMTPSRADSGGPGAARRAFQDGGHHSLGSAAAVSTGCSPGSSGSSLLCQSTETWGSSGLSSFSGAPLLESFSSNSQFSPSFRCAGHKTDAVSLGPVEEAGLVAPDGVHSPARRILEFDGNCRDETALAAVQQIASSSSLSLSSGGCRWGTIVDQSIPSVSTWMAIDRQFRGVEGEDKIGGQKFVRSLPPAPRQAAFDTSPPGTPCAGFYSSPSGSSCSSSAGDNSDGEKKEENEAAGFRPSGAVLNFMSLTPKWVRVCGSLETTPSRRLGAPESSSLAGAGASPSPRVLRDSLNTMTLTSPLKRSPTKILTPSKIPRATLKASPSTSPSKVSPLQASMLRGSPFKATPTPASKFRGSPSKASPLPPRLPTHSGAPSPACIGTGCSIAFTPPECRRPRLNDDLLLLESPAGAFPNPLLPDGSSPVLRPTQVVSPTSGLALALPQGVTLDAFRHALQTVDGFDDRLRGELLDFLDLLGSASPQDPVPSELLSAAFSNCSSREDFSRELLSRKHSNDRRGGMPAHSARSATWSLRSGSLHSSLRSARDEYKASISASERADNFETAMLQRMKGLAAGGASGEAADSPAERLTLDCCC